MWVQNAYKLTTNEFSIRSLCWFLHIVLNFFIHKCIFFFFRFYFLFWIPFFRQAFTDNLWNLSTFAYFIVYGWVSSSFNSFFFFFFLFSAFFSTHLRPCVLFVPYICWNRLFKFRAWEHVAGDFFPRDSWQCYHRTYLIVAAMYITLHSKELKNWKTKYQN